MEEVPLRLAARRVQIEPAVPVEVGDRGRHSVGANLRVGGVGDVHEAVSPIVVVEIFQAEVVRDEQIGPAVAVVVGEEGGKRPAGRLRDSPGLAHVREVAVPVVQEQKARASVVGVVRRIGHLSVVVARDANEEVQIPVSVDVGERGGARVLRNVDAGGGGHVLEGAVPAVVKKMRASEGVRDEEVRVAVSIDVARGHARCGDAFGRRRGEPRGHGDVREMAVSVVAIQNRPHAVAHEEIFRAVLVVVQNGDAGPGPDAGDEVVREPVGRIVARRSEAGFRRRVVEARIALRSVGNGFEVEHACRWLRFSRTGARFDRSAGLALDAGSVVPEAADRE